MNYVGRERLRWWRGDADALNGEQPSSDGSWLLCVSPPTQERERHNASTAALEERAALLASELGATRRTDRDAQLPSPELSRATEEGRPGER